MTQQPENSLPALSPQEHMRRRPGMYVGALDGRGILQMTNYGIEAMRHYELTNRLVVTLLPDDTVSIQGDGTGLQVDLLDKMIPSVETWYGHVASHLQPENYFKVINALSEQLKVEIYYDGFLWEKIYGAGTNQTELIQVRALRSQEHRGVKLTFKPDPAIFEQRQLDHYRYVELLNDLAIFNPDLTITLRDERTSAVEPEISFCYKDGIRDFLEHINSNARPIHPMIYCDEHFDAVATVFGNRQLVRKMRIEIAFQYIDSMESRQFSYAGERQTTAHGTHQEAFMSALHYFLSQDVSLALEDIVPGLTSVIGVWHPGLQLSSLSNPAMLNEDMENPMLELIVNTLARFAETNPDDMQHIIDKCLANKKARYNL